MKCFQEHKILPAYSIVIHFIVIISVFVINPVSALSKEERNAHETVKNAIVKVYTMKSEPYYFNPWRMPKRR